MKINKGLYFITNSDQYEEQEFLSRVEQVCKEGISLLQVREKNMSDDKLYDMSRKVKSIADKYGIDLIIDDRVEVAKKLAVGVHLGVDDMSIKEARSILGPDAIVGATAKTVERAKQAYEEGASYLGTGAIYPTTTHVKTRITSVETVKEIVKSVPIPVFALGGLREDNLSVLKDTGIHGICIVSRIMNAEYPGDMTKKVKEAMKEIDL